MHLRGEKGLKCVMKRWESQGTEGMCLFNCEGEGMCGVSVSLLYGHVTLQTSHYLVRFNSLCVREGGTCRERVCRGPPLPSSMFFCFVLFCLGFVLSNFLVLA